MTALQPNQQVRIKGRTTAIGILTGREKTRNGVRRLQVKFTTETQYIPEDQLEPAPEEQESSEVLLSRGQLAGVEDLRRVLTHHRLSGKLADMVYSMQATNTDFYAYQFKPVIKILQSPNNGLLIADEVGLGKTIEAGLIWTELRSRFDMRRLMVICPAALCDKWRWELSTKMGVDARIVNAKDALETLRDPEAQRRGFALIASMQGLRPPKGWDNDETPHKSPRAQLARYLRDQESEEPTIDLLVIDEAHHLRNPSTATHRLGQLFREVADFRILLSATPVHNRNEDLLSALRLLDPEMFSRPQDFDDMLQANVPLIRAREMVLSSDFEAQALVEQLELAQKHHLLEGNRQLLTLLRDLSTYDDLTSVSTRSELASRLERVNLMAHTITRTRKRDVQSDRVVRDPVAVNIPMSEAESDFYTGITDTIRQYASEHDVNDVFLLSTAQRQLSSSMPAALARWSGLQAELAESDEDYTSDDDEKRRKMGPLIRCLAEEAAQLGTVEELERDDGKLARLLDLLKRHLKDHPKGKVVVFSAFRDTLRYLSRRLEAAKLSTIVLMGSDGGRRIDKTEVQDQFRSEDGPSILLSSEVGAEGIDLQFANVLVNYDLPWNPMRLEQRIGRLDRIGQESDKIHIFNLLQDGTIDAKIYSRLYEKLDLCRNALGDFDAILGKKVIELQKLLILDSLTPEEQDARLKASAQALENIRKHQEDLENHAHHLVAYGDYILRQVKEAHDLARWITGDDIRRYVKDFFCKYYPGCEFHQADVSDSALYTIRLTPEAKHELSTFVRERALQTTRLTDMQPAPTTIRFDHRVDARRSKTVEVVTQLHPVVRFVGQEIRRREKQLTPAVAVRVRSASETLPPGTYVVCVSFWSMTGLRTQEKLGYAGVRLNGEDFTEIGDDVAEALVGEATRAGATWREARVDVDLELAHRGALHAFERLDTRYGREVDQARAENEDRADIQRRTLEKHVVEQRQKLEILYMEQQARGSRIANATRGKLDALQSRMEAKKMKIDDEKELVHRDSEILSVLIECIQP